MDIANLKVGNNTYGIKDSTARTNASNANTKIDGASIVGEYTSGTETLEISLELGEIQQKGE